MANNPETEEKFRAVCALHESRRSATIQTPNKDYQNFLNHYHWITSLYTTEISEIDDNKTVLIIYNTKRERESDKILETPEPLDDGTCIAQLPSGDLFCFGNHKVSGIALIIDRNFKIRVLPSGMPCYWSSAIYFNNNVYCFGDYSESPLAVSSKFDLNDNRWIKLAPMLKAYYKRLSIIFNENILISGYKNANLMLYSINIDSFSIIPYTFGSNRRKILINAERLYLIECWEWFIYESEDEYNWKQISSSIIRYRPYQVYCSYNKGGIYIFNVSLNASLDHV